LEEFLDLPAFLFPRFFNNTCLIGFRAALNSGRDAFAAAVKNSREEF
jgi:hypothetical protein